MEVEKDKEHQEPLAKKQNTALSRESMIEAKSQEIRASRQEVTVEVSSDSESSGYSNSTEHSPLSKNQHEDDMTSTSKEEGRPIDIEEVNQTPKAGGDALLVKPNPDLGRCTTPLWLRQMLMPRGEVVTIQAIEDIQGLAEKEDDARQKKMAETVAKVIRSDDDGHWKVQIAIPRVSKAADEIVAQDYEIVEHDLGKITDDMECDEIQEGVASIREKLRKANEENARLRVENRYWRNCYQGAYLAI